MEGYHTCPACLFSRGFLDYVERPEKPTVAADTRACRQVGTAAPVLAALAGGGDREATVSALYGGSGGADSATSAVYAAIGNVRTHIRTCAEVIKRHV